MLWLVFFIRIIFLLDKALRGLAGFKSSLPSSHKAFILLAIPLGPCSTGTDKCSLRIWGLWDGWWRTCPWQWQKVTLRFLPYLLTSRQVIWDITLWLCVSNCSILLRHSPTVGLFGTPSVLLHRLPLPKEASLAHMALQGQGYMGKLTPLAAVSKDVNQPWGGSHEGTGKR